MRKLLTVLAAVGSFAIGPAVYAMPDLQSSDCRSASVTGMRTVCEACGISSCSGCEIVGHTSDGKPVL